MREFIHGDQLRGHTAVVLGAGSSGIAAARLLVRLGATVRLLERSESVAASVPTDQGFDVRGGQHRPEDFQGATLVVLSPGIPGPRSLPCCPRARRWCPNWNWPAGSCPSPSSP